MCAYACVPVCVGVWVWGAVFTHVPIQPPGFQSPCELLLLLLSLKNKPLEIFCRRPGSDNRWWTAKWQTLEETQNVLRRNQDRRKTWMNRTWKWTFGSWRRRLSSWKQHHPITGLSPPSKAGPTPGSSRKKENELSMYFVWFLFHFFLF